MKPVTKFSSFAPPSPFDADGRRRFSTLPASEGPRATQWGTKRKPKAKGWRHDFLPDWMTAEEAEKLTPFEKAWMKFVRTLPCCCTHLGGCRGRVQASHITLSANQKGMAMRVNVKQTVPHCDRHHRDWDGRSGVTGNPFAGMSKDQKRALGGEWVRDVLLLATPEDHDQALAFRALGLGTIAKDEARGTWAWVPGRAAVSWPTDPVLLAASYVRRVRRRQCTPATLMREIRRRWPTISMVDVFRAVGTP